MKLQASRWAANKLSLYAILFSLSLWAQPAGAITDRAHLEKWCTHGSSAAAGRCIGYLLAAEDALANDRIEGIQACLPNDISLQEQHDLVLRWLAEHPEIQAMSALGLVARAYAEKYPCGR